MTVTVDLPPDVAARLSEKAAQEGQDVSGYVQHLAVREAGLWDETRLSAWDALLDSFEEGDVEDYRDTVVVLARGLNEDRPSQCRVRGFLTEASGDNPCA